MAIHSMLASILHAKPKGTGDPQHPCCAYNQSKGSSGLSTALVRSLGYTFNDAAKEDSAPYPSFIAMKHAAITMASPLVFMFHGIGRTTAMQCCFRRTC